MWSLRRIVPAGAAALMLLGGASGCMYMPWDEAARNIENSKQLRVGMTKAEVLNVMGEPVTDEVYCTPDVWFYFVQSVWMDGLTTEDECMPLVFQDGRLVGWGNAFYTRFRIEKKEGGKALQP